jgi:hypothetical protein
MAKHAQDDRDATLIGHPIDIALVGHASPDQVISAERPFTDALPRCEENWTELLAGQRYQDVRVKSALYTYEPDGLPARVL